MACKARGFWGGHAPGEQDARSVGEVAARFLQPIAYEEPLSRLICGFLEIHVLRKKKHQFGGSIVFLAALASAAKPDLELNMPNKQAIPTENSCMCGCFIRYLNRGRVPVAAVAAETRLQIFGRFVCTGKGQTFIKTTLLRIGALHGANSNRGDFTIRRSWSPKCLSKSRQIYRRSTNLRYFTVPAVSLHLATAL